MLDAFTHSQHVCVYVRRIQQACDRLHKDEERDDHQEQAVDEAGKYFNAAEPAKQQNPQFIENPAGGDVLSLHDESRWILPVGEDPGGFPAGHESSEQAEDQSRAVEQHVEAVGDEAQAVGPDAIKQLHEGESLKRCRATTCDTSAG